VGLTVAAYITAEELRLDLSGRGKRLETLMPPGASSPADITRLCATASAVLDGRLAACPYVVPIDTTGNEPLAALLRARATDQALIELSDGLDVRPDFIRAAQERVDAWIKDLAARKAHLPGYTRIVP
jgi:hypothetical protein